MVLEVYYSCKHCARSQQQLLLYCMLININFIDIETQCNDYHKTIVCVCNVSKEAIRET